MLSVVVDTATLELEIARRLSQMGSVLPPRGSVWIFTHDYPDPDAMASAAALHLLFQERFKRNSHIYFTGCAARAENREMNKHFRYRTIPSERIRTGRHRVTPAFFVDSQPWSGNIQVPAAARAVGVFDHHPLSRRAKTEGMFLDIRPGVGATASIMWEYLNACSILPPAWLATCLCYAILTETRSFTRGFTPLDRQAYLSLLTRADLRMLGSIQQAPLPQSYFAALQEGFMHTRFYGHIAWTHLKSAPHPELISEIADQLLRLERITWSFCTGVIDGQLMVSLRSARRDTRCDRILKTVMGPQGSAGGHDRMSAGSMDLRALSTEEREERIGAFTRALLRRLDPRHAARDDAEALESRRLTEASRTPEPTPPAPAT